LGGFTAWVSTLGGILAPAGVTGFLANLTALYDSMDDETKEWEACLGAWYRRYGDTPVLIAEVLRRFKDGTAMTDVLPNAVTQGLDASFGSLSKRLGKALAKKAGTVIGDYGLESLHRDVTTNATRWRVVNIG
jgi:hypothetical protein